MSHISKRHLLQGSAAFGLLSLAGIPKRSEAQTLLSKIFIASTGSDSNDGAPSTPKRTLQAAHNAVAIGGEIVILNTAGYGSLSISKDVSVTAPPGINGFITVSSGTAVNIQANLKVALRGLTIQGTSSQAITGIYSSGVQSAVIDSCRVSGFGNAGNSSSGGIVMGTSTYVGNILIKDTEISACPGGGIVHGIIGNPNSLCVLVVERCNLFANNTGLLSGSSGRATVRDSYFVGNTGIAIQSGGYVSGDVIMNIEGCTVTGNGTGIYGYSNNNAFVSNTLISGNTTGVTGTVKSYGNNTLLNNTTDGSMATPLLARK